MQASVSAERVLRVDKMISRLGMRLDECTCSPGVEGCNARDAADWQWQPPLAVRLDGATLELSRTGAS